MRPQGDANSLSGGDTRTSCPLTRACACLTPGAVAPIGTAFSFCAKQGSETDLSAEPGLAHTKQRTSRDGRLAPSGTRPRGGGPDPTAQSRSTPWLPAPGRTCKTAPATRPRVFPKGRPRAHGGQAQAAPQGPAAPARHRTPAPHSGLLRGPDLGSLHTSRARGSEKGRGGSICVPQKERPHPELQYL